jgi:hypothetical protein
MSGSRLQWHDISIFWQTLNGDDVKWCRVDYISLTVNYGNPRNETWYGLMALPISLGDDLNHGQSLAGPNLTSRRNHQPSEVHL